MQVGISQIVLPDLLMTDFFTLAASAGYEVVEVSMRPSGDLTPATGEQQLRQFTDQARSAGVELVSMTHTHLTGNLLDSDAEQQVGIDETRAGLRAAAEMGIGCTLHTLGNIGFDLCYDEAYRNAVESLSQIAQTASQLNVTVAIEFVWNGFLFSPLEMKQLLDEVGSPHVGFYFDPGNMAVFHYPHHWVRILGHHTKMVHLKDWKGTALNGAWPPLLEGDLDFAAINAELRAVGYDGPMISEVPPSVAPIEKTAEAIGQIIKM